MRPPAIASAVTVALLVAGCGSASSGHVSEKVASVVTVDSSRMSVVVRFTNTGDAPERPGYCFLTLYRVDGKVVGDSLGWKLKDDVPAGKTVMTAVSVDVAASDQMDVSASDAEIHC